MLRLPLRKIALSLWIVVFVLGAPSSSAPIAAAPSIPRPRT